jgi:hypothetical protein
MHHAQATVGYANFSCEAVLANVTALGDAGFSCSGDQLTRTALKATGDVFETSAAADGFDALAALIQAFLNAKAYEANPFPCFAYTITLDGTCAAADLHPVPELACGCKMCYTVSNYTTTPTCGEVSNALNVITELYPPDTWACDASNTDGTSCTTIDVTDAANMTGVAFKLEEALGLTVGNCATGTIALAGCDKSDTRISTGACPYCNQTYVSAPGLALLSHPRGPCRLRRWALSQPHASQDAVGTVSAHTCLDPPSTTVCCLALAYFAAASCLGMSAAAASS